MIPVYAKLKNEMNVSQRNTRHLRIQIFVSNRYIVIGVTGKRRLKMT